MRYFLLLACLLLPSCYTVGYVPPDEVLVTLKDGMTQAEVLEKCGNPETRVDGPVAIWGYSESKKAFLGKTLAWKHVQLMFHEGKLWSYTPPAKALPSRRRAGTSTSGSRPR